MKNTTKKATSLFLALTMGLALVGCNAASSSSEAVSSSAAPEADSSAQSTITASFGAASNFDYENFDFSLGLTDGGLWDGVTASDYVTLPEDFATISVPTADVTPSDEVLEQTIQQMLDSHAAYVAITDRAAALNDTVDIDYVGSVDGIEFVGGTAMGYSLVLGSGRFIPGFEDQIVGHEVGDTFDVTVTFPEGYDDSEDAAGNVIPLSGQEAVFHVKLNGISVLTTPELTDAWVLENIAETTGIQTVDALYEQLTTELFAQNKDNYINDYLLQNSTISEVPESVVAYQVCQFLSYYSAMAQGYGMTLEDFVPAALHFETVDEFLAAEENNSIMYFAKLALIQQAAAEQLDIVIDDAALEPYAEYLATNPKSYVALNALVETVTLNLRDNAVMQ